jgi:hypothetical protein
VIFYDNVLTIKLSKNPVMHGHNKHIDIQFYFLRDLIKDGIVELLHCFTQEQMIDIITKPLKLEVFLKARFNGCLRIPWNKLKINDIHFKGGC